jgi:flagellar motor switch/type III secretory pathway protein FliN
VSTSPEPAPTALLAAAVTAAAEAVTVTALTAGPVRDDDPGRPAGMALLVGLSLSGACTGTVVLAADDELVERLEYGSGVSGSADALAPVAAAVVAALGATGPLEATPLVEVEDDAWPGEGPAVSTVILTGAPDPEDAAKEGADRPVLALAFALTMTPAPVSDELAVSGPGQSSMSTSTSTGPAPSWVPGSGQGPGGPLTAEARRLAAVEVEVAAVLGETSVVLHDLLAWLPGVIVPLHREVGVPVDVRIDETTVAHADLVVVDERYALRVIDVVAGAPERVAYGRAPSGMPEPSDPLPPESSP